MKRYGLGVLAFLGFACLTAAVGTKLFLVPQLRVVPLDLDITSVATTVAPDGKTGERFPATLFDRCSINERRAKTFDAHLTQQRRSRVVDPSDRRQATVQSAQTVRIDRIRERDGKETAPTMAKAGEERTCTDALLTASIDRVSVDRKTSVPNGAVNAIQTEAAPEGTDPKTVSVEAKRQGFQYKFGFNVKKRDYLYYDLNTRQDTRVRFVEEKEIHGVKAYHFVTEVPETDLADLETPQGEAALGTMVSKPARWWGVAGRGVKPTETLTMHRYATSTRHVWVEPSTGTIMDGREDQHQYFRFPDQSEETPAAVRDFRMDSLKATFQWSPETVKAQAERAETYASKLRFGQDTLPLIFAGAGGVFLLLWLVGLFVTRRSSDDDSPAVTKTAKLDREAVDDQWRDDEPTAAVQPSPWRDESPWQRSDAGGPSAAPTTQFSTGYPAEPQGPVPDEHWHYNQQGQYVADQDQPDQGYFNRDDR
ncbi:hypothetical protein GOARA_068_00390 [Gordonia araii NBRC 100433]|uniref:DUF3068 domain-containing protein n=1 Tax=Gordonia araii NBRC 100433 TaxID=1073574 RepID=G7H6A5_9ACTN|nr:DUF3068 domain-containing protein [Gordonia araii]NNG96060.1 DUF3068 domain-containing protein [Gordonia araii NBRC 100433]GAB11380.1 hypothetical protein GOARA_068_00390 [Gordonia araii NBRC 100433]